MAEQRLGARYGGGLATAVCAVVMLQATPATADLPGARAPAAPAAVGTWTENFDTYNTNQNLPSQSTWESWGNDPNAANFFATTAQFQSGPNSVEIDGPDDAVHRYRGYTLGKWEYFAWVFIPQGMNGLQYFILLNNYPGVNSQDWSMQIELDGANAVVNDFNSGASVPMTKGQWTWIRIIIDLDKDLQQVYYNFQHLVTKSWSGGVAAGGLVNIGAVDLWANNVNVAVYYDDMYLGPPPLGAPSFSIDFQGPLMGFPDSLWGLPITEAEILMSPPPFFPLPGPLPPPAVCVWGGPGSPTPDLGLAMWPNAWGHPPGIPGFVEVDALSYGSDFNWGPTMPWPGFWAFSVDEIAWGIPGGPPPSVTTEGSWGAMDASADVFHDWAIGPGPFPPQPPGIMWNQDLYDGDGIPPFGGPGYGLVEPNPPTPFFVPDPGSTLDALDVDEAVGPQYAPFPVYFSLDSGFPDPTEPWPPVNSGSAMAHGFVGGDVLMTPVPGAPPVVYAPALLLGLDQMGPDTDDLDALALWENGDGIYQPSQQPLDWLGGNTDMLLFSVRRASAVIGAPDSLWGAPIEEGDILCPPVAGGMSPFPGIMIPAEMIGLGTVRSGTQEPNLGFADDLNALDLWADCNGTMLPDPYDIFMGFSADCNSNFIPDLCDIQIGTSLDCNNNSIPDECESPPPCPEDVNGDCIVNTSDLLLLLADWGCSGSMCPGDVDGDGDTDTSDLLALLAGWGPC